VVLVLEGAEEKEASMLDLIVSKGNAQIQKAMPARDPASNVHHMGCGRC
jgi:hypothetical protein